MGQRTACAQENGLNNSVYISPVDVTPGRVTSALRIGFRKPAPAPCKRVALSWEFLL